MQIQIQMQIHFAEEEVNSHASFSLFLCKLSLYYYLSL